MSELVEKEILEELKRINERLEKIEKSKGLTPTTKIAAVILGFLVIGPVISLFISIFSPMIRFFFS